MVLFLLEQPHLSRHLCIHLGREKATAIGFIRGFSASYDRLKHFSNTEVVVARIKGQYWFRRFRILGWSLAKTFLSAAAAAAAVIHWMVAVHLRLIQNHAEIGDNR
jgi:hypothetical protein